MKKIPSEEFTARKFQNDVIPKMPFSVLLNNVRSLYNVGSIFRTADGAGIEKLWLCGITGHPPHPRLSKTALGAEQIVPWEYRPDAVALVGELKRKGYQVVLLEQLKESVPYEEFEWKPPVCLILGNENNGVSDELLSVCDAAVDIKMSGLKASLNVTVAFGVAAFHFREMLQSPSLKHLNPDGIPLY